MSEFAIFDSGDQRPTVRSLAAQQLARSVLSHRRADLAMVLGVDQVSRSIVWLTSEAVAARELAATFERAALRLQSLRQ